MLDFPPGSVITDPILRGRVGYLRRVAPAPDRPRRSPALILVSHVHHDHLDGPSLRHLDPRTPIVAPRGAGRLLRAKGMRAIVELLPGEERRFGAITVRATPAEHAVTRLPGGPSIPALGYVVECGWRVFFAGDTDLFDGMRAIGDTGIDVALAPVTGWGPRVPPGHLDPLRAAQAMTLLRPQIAVPIHWGTLAPMWWRRRPPAVTRAPAEEFARHAARVSPAVDVRILDPGDTLTLPVATHGT